MAAIDVQISTGLPGLDEALKGLLPGDNVVWQVDSIEDYRPFLEPLCATARAHGRRIVYFRFAGHEPLLEAGRFDETHCLNPEAGFEQFLTEVHRVIDRMGRGTFYVFDCLSDLVADWYSDRALGNFFMLTCPYLYDLETITYFAIARGRHSVHAMEPILQTTQVFLDVYRHKDRLCLRPLKVQRRYSPTMHMLHVRRGEDFVPVADSQTISELMADTPWTALGAKDYRMTFWNGVFFETEKTVEAEREARAKGRPSPTPPERSRSLLRQTLRMIVSRDDRVVELAERYLTLEDIAAIKRRLIGTGLIGGKTVGMWLARAILRAADPKWRDRLEAHDSFYIGSDVFYTFLVVNGCWWVR
jgi:hypothetical protein